MPVKKRKKKPAQLQREIDETLAKPVTADTITDKQIRELLNAGLVSEWEARGAFRYTPDREEASDPYERRKYVADVFNQYKTRG